jgi:proline iminopeptidase
VRKIFPELWRDFAGLVPEEERGDLRKAYCERILGDDRVLAEEAARRLYLYEEGFMHFDAPLAPPDPTRGAAYGRIFAHYASHDFFLRNAELLENADRLGDIPLILLTGRYDMCTTPDNAWDLAQRVGHADLRVVAGGGHYPTELAMAVACVRAGEDFLRLCQQRLGS